MLGKGWFLQGHLDKSEKCLMVSNRVYEQYLETEKNTREREAEEARMREEELKRTGGLTPEDESDTGERQRIHRKHTKEQ